MARTLSIVQITQSASGSPGRIDVSGNLVSSFQGKFYRSSVGATLPGYTTPTPSSAYTLIAATTFTIVNNPSYNGTYTVYSPISAVDPTPSSTFSSGVTEVYVNEVVSSPITNSDLNSTGQVTNISTYVIAIEGEASLVVPPTVQFSNRPLDIIGRNGQPWAESYTQNFVKLAQSFAGAQPANPFLGQLWYDDTLNVLNLNTAGGFVTIASGTAGANTTFRFTQTAAATTWVVPHNLGLASPFVGIVQIFVDTGGGVYKMIFPSDMSFDSVNQLTITFTAAQKGIVLIRA
jgi:hypothetical protein